MCQKVLLPFMTNMQSFWYNTSCLFGRICHFSFGQRLCCTRVWKEVVLTTSPFQKSSPARKALFHPSDQDSLCSWEALITTHTMSFHASNGSISPNIKLFLWFFFPFGVLALISATCPAAGCHFSARTALRWSWPIWLWRRGPAWTSSSAPACWEIWVWPGGVLLFSSPHSLLPVPGSPAGQKTDRLAKM